MKIRQKCHEKVKIGGKVRRLFHRHTWSYWVGSNRRPFPTPKNIRFSGTPFLMSRSPTILLSFFNNKIERKLRSILLWSLLTRDRVRAKRRAATHSVATECYRFCLVVNLQAPENFLDFRMLVVELLGGIEPPTCSLRVSCSTD